ncbi:hypothetical protein AB0F17_26515 [Nonomuraea sp. NPDC026600]|uniref:hypothetical protein n=1 Tax=Nonomuraea sp. NPDC026600 TaxID=3155363 RepID=UPI0033C96A7A
MADERLQGDTDACAKAGLEPPVPLTVHLEIAGAAQFCYDLHDVARHRAETIVTSLAGAGQTTHHAGISADASTHAHVTQRSST